MQYLPMNVRKFLSDYTVSQILLYANGEVRSGQYVTPNFTRIHKVPLATNTVTPVYLGHLWFHSKPPNLCRWPSPETNWHYETRTVQYQVCKCTVQNAQAGVKKENSYTTSQWLGTWSNHWPIQNYNVHSWRKSGDWLDNR